MKKPKPTIAGLQRLVDFANERANVAERVENQTRRCLDKLIEAIYGRNSRGDQSVDGAMLLVGQLHERAQGIENRMDDRAAALQRENDKLWEHVRALSGITVKRTDFERCMTDFAKKASVEEHLTRGICIRHGVRLSECGCKPFAGM